MLETIPTDDLIMELRRRCHSCLIVICKEPKNQPARLGAVTWYGGKGGWPAALGLASYALRDIELQVFGSADAGEDWDEEDEES